ncbi:MAG TPA: uracil-DNA glycosylase [Bryobacteraceae bacterium]|jgi:uracil-DNA glycosylase family 4|nr:uracil-DNA glycosylase [Bryobacteraceae bacterium]
MTETVSQFPCDFFSFGNFLATASKERKFLTADSLEISLLRILEQQIIECRLCPRLVAHREEIGRIQRRAYRGQTYWSRPVPGFGDPAARLLVIGLAPGAHGANRTGRIFTGDRSGDFLYPALWQAGFANQPTSVDRNDGLLLHDAYITSPVRCVPPDNKPTLQEIRTCRPYLIRELALLPNIKVIVVLGGIALIAYLSVLQDAGHISARTPFRFAHGATYTTYPGAPIVLASYHPSQQNTSTKRLTAEMLAAIFRRARLLIDQSQ